MNTIGRQKQLIVDYLTEKGPSYPIEMVDNLSVENGEPMYDLLEALLNLITDSALGVDDAGKVYLVEEHD